MKKIKGEVIKTVEKEEAHWALASSQAFVDTFRSLEHDGELLIASHV